MIITIYDFAKITGLSAYFINTIFDRFNIKRLGTRYYKYDVSWFDLQNIKEFLKNKKDKKPHDYSYAIKKIDELCEG